MPLIEINAVWTDDGQGNKKKKFRTGVDQLRLICQFYIDESLASQAVVVIFDFTWIDRRNNDIWHVVFPTQVLPQQGGWYLIGSDFGVQDMSPGFNWFQVLASVQGHDEMAVSPEGFFEIVPANYFG